MVGRTLSRAEQRQLNAFWQRKAFAKKMHTAFDTTQRPSPTFPYLYRYCECCRFLIDIVGKDDPGPPVQHCEGCQFLIDHALMPPPNAEAKG